MREEKKKQSCHVPAMWIVFGFIAPNPKRRLSEFCWSFNKKLIWNILNVSNNSNNVDLNMSSDQGQKINLQQ